MKNYIITLVACMALSLGAKAMGYDQARQEALFLTDKMAYELNLSLEQMEAVYEINLDYFLCVNRSQDLYGIYWQRRNSDLRYVLSRNQYAFFININYFYRPLNWVRGAWSLALYGRYTNRHQFFYARPNAWFSFRGGRNTGGKSHYSYGNYYAPVGNGKPAAGHAPKPSGHGGFQRGNGPRPGYNGNRPNNGYQPGNNGNRPNNGYQPGNNGNRPNNGYQPGNNGNRPNNGYQPGNNGNRPNNGQPNTRPRRSGRPN